MKKVSVIIPVYNVAPYITQCIESVLGQTYSEIEVIVVDDGSADDGGTLCDAISQQDKRVKVIHQQNGGLSKARNVALDHANGDYVMFLDGDDFFCTEDVVAKMVESIETSDCDIVIAGHNEVEEDSRPLDLSKDVVCQKFSSYKDFWKYLAKTNSISCIVVWTKIYRKELWDDIRFPLGKKHEDEWVLSDLMKDGNKIEMIDLEAVSYRMRNTSVIHAKPSLSSINYTEAMIRRIESQIEDGFYDCLPVWYRSGMVYLMRAYENSDYRTNSKTSESVNSVYEKYKILGKHIYQLVPKTEGKIRFHLFCMGLKPYAFFRKLLRKN